MSVVDLRDLTDRDPPQRTRAQHTEDVRREGLRQKIKHMQNNAERAHEYLIDMTRAGSDVTEELQELDIFANGLLLIIALRRREILRRAETPTQFWQDEQE